MWRKILNFFFLRQRRANSIRNKLRDNLGENLRAEMAEEIFKLLLKGMALVFLLNDEFRKNLTKFNARYLFTSENKGLDVAVIYENNRMKVKEEMIKDTNVTVTFSDYKALIQFLTEKEPDVLDFMLNQKLSFKGNLNYLYKFGYMARHLLKMFEIAPA